jgi:hypothetical protein
MRGIAGASYFSTSAKYAPTRLKLVARLPAADRAVEPPLPRSW